MEGKREWFWLVEILADQRVSLHPTVFLLFVFFFSFSILLSALKVCQSRKARYKSNKLTALEKKMAVEELHKNEYISPTQHY